MLDFLRKFKGAKETIVADENTFILDVRSPGEYASGHIEGALSIPLDQVNLKISSLVNDQQASIIVYCLSGARSASARDILLNLGYVNVLNGGGISSLSLSLQRPVTR